MTEDVGTRCGTQDNDNVLQTCGLKDNWYNADLRGFRVKWGNSSAALQGNNQAKQWGKV